MNKKSPSLQAPIEYESASISKLSVENTIVLVPVSSDDDIFFTTADSESVFKFKTVHLISFASINDVAPPHVLAILRNFLSLNLKSLVKQFVEITNQ